MLLFVVLERSDNVIGVSFVGSLYGVLLHGDGGMGPVAVVVVLGIVKVFVFADFVVTRLARKVLPVGVPHLEGVMVCIVTVVCVLIMFVSNTHSF